MSAPEKHRLSQILNLTVFVAALGYFVDMFDLLLFPIVRQPSLTDLGIPQGDAQVSATFLLLNSQMVGMLLGGIFWGVLGDKKGRLSTLFGSIALYSVANIANAFVHGLPSYAVWRFLAGLGLAGELGAAVTLVSEILPRNLRAYGTAIVAGVGIFGTVTASLVGKYLPWRTAYLVGGGLGLVLLATRFSLRESGMFRNLGEQAGVTRGDFLSLFTRGERFLRYLRCILIGLPTWFVVAILITSAPEFAPKVGVTGPVAAGTAVAFCYSGITIGSFASGILSQVWGSRKKVVLLFILGTLVGVAAYLTVRGLTPDGVLPPDGVPRPHGGLLGRLRHDRRGAVRHEPPRHGGHHGAELRPGGRPADHGRLLPAPGPSGLRRERLDGGPRLHHPRPGLPLRHGRDGGARPGFPGVKPSRRFYVPRVSFWNLGFLRSGSKLGSILSQPGESR